MVYYNRSERYIFWLQMIRNDRKKEGCRRHRTHTRRRQSGNLQTKQMAELVFLFHFSVVFLVYWLLRFHFITHICVDYLQKRLCDLKCVWHSQSQSLLCTDLYFVRSVYAAVVVASCAGTHFSVLSLRNIHLLVIDSGMFLATLRALCLYTKCRTTLLPSINSIALVRVSHYNNTLQCALVMNQWSKNRFLRQCG